MDFKLERMSGLNNFVYRVKYCDLYSQFKVGYVTLRLRYYAIASILNLSNP
jgi:hypothetical protein